MLNTLLNIIKMLALAVAGVYLLLYPKESLFTAICILGIAVGCYGLFTCLAYLVLRGKKDQDGKAKRSVFSLVIGIPALVCGILLAVKPDLVADYFPVVSGLFVLAAGILSSAEAIVSWKVNAAWKSKLGVAVATIVLGVLFMFCEFDHGTAVRLLGTVMLYLGAAGLFEGKSEKPKLPDAEQTDEQTAEQTAESVNA